MKEESIPVRCALPAWKPYVCFSFSGHHQLVLLGNRQMSKFEEVSSDQHQMSLARGFPGLTSRGAGEVVCYLTFSGDGVPYHVTYPMMHLMILAQPPPCKQTDACESITFPQRYLRTVEMFLLGVRSH